MNNLSYKEYYQRNLPHYQPANGIFAVTFRLAFSLPAEIIEKLRSDKEEFERISQKISGSELVKYKHEFHKKYFENYDVFIGRYKSSPRWLENEIITNEVKSSLLFFNKKRYDLLTFCIMPNHVHIIIEPLNDSNNICYSLSKIMYTVKRFSATRCNKILNRKGQFWEHENYDHAIRDYRDFEYQIFYIKNNPVKAGLVSSWKNWKHTWIITDLQ